MEKSEFAATLKYAGAFIAWLIGSGFATGQEILQFFSSYGAKTFWVLLLNLIGFTVLGVILVLNGYDNKNRFFDHYEYYCGKTLGRIYSVTVPVSLIMIMAVLISAAGATFEQYYSVNRFLGSAVMSALILAVYLVGFEKMVKIVSAASPFVIIFTVFIGVYSAVKGFSNFESITAQSAALEKFRSSPHWLLSSFLYMSLNFLSGSVYYTSLGRSAVSRRSVKYGAILGAVAVIAAITFIAISILLSGNAIAEVSVPTLYLANKISPVFGHLFSIILMLGMFASSTTTLWSFCSGFFRKSPVKNKIFSTATLLACLGLGLVPFGKLVSVLYPLIGYFGLIFILCVLMNPFIKHKKAKHKE